MAKLSLIDMVQDILSDMNSDEVISISDTVEALQVAQIIKATYFHIIHGRDYPWLNTLFQLTASGTAARPTHLTIPETITKLHAFKYNMKTDNSAKDEFTTVTYKTPEEFLDILDARDSTASNVQVVSDTTGVTLNVYNDRHPTYYTTFDDVNLICDAFYSTLDSTLQSSKTKCFGEQTKTFTLTDNFVPDMPEQMFSFLLAEAKSICFNTLKQLPNAKAEQQAVSQRRRTSGDAWKVQGGITYPDYGRKR